MYGLNPTKSQSFVCLFGPETNTIIVTTIIYAITIHRHPLTFTEVSVPKEVTCDSISAQLKSLEEEGKGGVPVVDCNEDGSWFARQCLGKYSKFITAIAQFLIRTVTLR